MAVEDNKEGVVLIVDDEVATRDRLTSLLEEAGGITVYGCGSDRNVVTERLAGLDPLCVVVDVPVADDTGLSLVRAVCESAPSAAVVVVSNRTSLELERACLRAGARHFLTKYTEFERIVSLVQSLQEAR